MMAAGHLLGNLVMTGVLLNVSYHNYPGGNALRFLNEHVPANQGEFATHNWVGMIKCNSVKSSY